MRPKKVILCVDDNEQDLSVLKFMLVTKVYRALAATTGQDAIALFADNQVDLVLADHAMPQMGGDQLVLKLKQIAAHVPMVILGDPQKMNGQIHGADALLAKKTCSPQELLERVKIMSARKRGPRKGVSRMVAAELGCAPEQSSDKEGICRGWPRFRIVSPDSNDKFLTFGTFPLRTT